MQAIESYFNAYFEPWDIHLPPEDFARRRAGRIVQAGWTIWYRFDADDRGEYLDFYANHRMTDDRHVRIRTDGEMDESLPTIQAMRQVSPDPDEDKQLEAAFLAQNRAVAELLARKGFDLQGDEPMAVQMNRHLRTKRSERE